MNSDAARSSRLRAAAVDAIRRSQMGRRGRWITADMLWHAYMNADPPETSAFGYDGDDGSYAPIHHNLKPDVTYTERARGIKFRPILQ